MQRSSFSLDTNHGRAFTFERKSHIGKPPLQQIGKLMQGHTPHTTHTRAHTWLRVVNIHMRTVCMRVCTSMRKHTHTPWARPCHTERSVQRFMSAWSKIYHERMCASVRQAKMRQCAKATHTHALAQTHVCVCVRCELTCERSRIRGV